MNPPTALATLPLRLAALEAPALAPAAWFIPGADAQTWLREMNLWNVPLAAAQIFILRAPGADALAGGALVLLPGRPQRVRRAQAYGVLEARLFLPVASRLEPPCSSAELNELLSFELQIFHPALGWHGFRREEALTVASLLQAPPRHAGAWNGARHAAALYGRLVSIDPAEALTLEQLLRDAQGDIGSQPIQKLPRGSSEGSPAVERALDLGKSGLKTGLKGLIGIAAAPFVLTGLLLSMLPGLRGSRAGGGGRSIEGGGAGGTGESLFDSLRNWAKQAMAWVDERLQAARNRELNRLLEMLEKDPDAGLRHAIPLGGSGARGLASPGDRLVTRSTDFNLNRLNGGGPADPWDIPAELQALLRQKYLDAANRELALKRYRRAAYIFAELLGDHYAAANALEQGRFFREAAVIYAEVLKNKGKAAQCLASGGLLLDAIRLYEELEAWIDAGRLYEKLERPDDARACFLKSVERELQAGRLLDGAKLQRELLRDDTGALAILARGWPDHSEAARCVQTRFAWLGELGRHDEGRREIRTLLDSARDGRLAARAAALLSEAATKYPDDGVRTAAADATRVIAGKRIRGESLGAAQELVGATWRLEPRDTLLARDAARYMARRRTREVSLPRIAPRAPADIRKLKSKNSFWIREFPLCAAAFGGSDLFYCAGFIQNSGLHVARGNWNGGRQSARFLAYKELGGERMAERTVSLHGNQGETLLIVGVSGGARAQVLNLKECPIFPDRSVSVFYPDFLPPHDALCLDEHDHLCVVERKSISGGFAIDLGIYSLTGKLLETRNLLMESESRPISILAQGERVFAATGETLFISDAKGSHFHNFERPIFQMALTRPHTRLRVAVALDDGGYVLWPAEAGTEAPQKFGEGLQQPRVAFTAGGDLVAVSASEMRVYRTDGKKLVLCASEVRGGLGVLSVTRTSALDEFAIFNANGLVEVLQIPS